MADIPQHIAIIMDGNGRWAKSRGKERVDGHVMGAENIRRVLNVSIRRGVKYLTLYAFSTENWGRPEDEVNALMELLCLNIENETPQLKEQGVRMKFIGDIDALSDKVRASIAYSESETADNEVITMVIALNYSSRWEIVRMVRNISSGVDQGEFGVDAIDATMVSQNMVTASIPDPDLLIRTSGESRLSNFLLWQLAYTELYFTNIYWPDFDEAEFDKAIEEYNNRERRYGLINKPH